MEKIISKDINGNRKIGESHPRFVGLWITPLGVFSSCWEAAKAEGSYDNAILRKCRRGEVGYGFKVAEGKEPKWYKKLLRDSEVKGLSGSVILSGDVTRGKNRVMWLTPNGLFGDIGTALSSNAYLDEVELKKRCLIGKKGWKVVVC